MSAGGRPEQPPAPLASPPTAADVRALRREVAGAGDTQVLQVLRIVEGLERRGDADVLLAPVRPRLRVLRPARALRFNRVLFMPLDPVIVDAANWRPGLPLLPRTALNCLAAAVRAALPKLADEVDGLIRGGSAADDALVRRVGSMLWAEASRVLTTAAMPAGWGAESLPAAEFPVLAAAVACCLEAEARFAALEQPGMARGDVEEALSELLEAADKRGPLCWGMLLALMVQRFPGADAAIRAAQSRAEGVGALSGRAALDLAARWVEACAEHRGAGDLHCAAGELRRQIAVLDKLAGDPARRQRATEVRVALQASCVHRFTTGLQERIATKLQPLPATGADEVLETMERDARDLRQFETEARRLGGSAGYDEQLRTMARAVMAQPGWGQFDRVRLVEILAGTQAAMQALAAGVP